jgi:hypothetical protein
VHDLRRDLGLVARPRKDLAQDDRRLGRQAPALRSPGVQPVAGRRRTACGPRDVLALESLHDKGRSPTPNTRHAKTQNHRGVVKARRDGSAPSSPPRAGGWALAWASTRSKNARAMSPDRSRSRFLVKTVGPDGIIHTEANETAETGDCTRAAQSSCSSLRAEWRGGRSPTAGTLSAYAADDTSSPSAIGARGGTSVNSERSCIA